MAKKTQITTTNRIWSANIRARVGDVVTHNSGKYINTTGKNSEPGTGIDWFLLDVAFDLGISIEDTNVSGVYGINPLDAGNWELTLTGNTIITETSTLPVGFEKTITIYVTGLFSLDLPAAWIVNIVGAYDGSIENQIVVQIRHNSTLKYKTVINE